MNLRDARFTALAPPGGHGHFADADALSRRLDDPARDEWQRPDEVLRAMALAPAMSVADVGAGTGYFAVRLARAVPAGEVTATDVEPNLVRFLHERAVREGLSNLRAILATSPLERERFDRILVVHVWHHLADRGAFARELDAALRPGGRLFVVEFAVDAVRGPPPGLRVTPDVVVAALALAGLSAGVAAVDVPGQYVVEARRGP